MFGFWGGLGGYDDWGPDRRNWRDKSDAARRRETQAIALFDAFLVECKTATSFPVTNEALVPPQVHLTDACWKTFKNHVTDKGCTTKRREATHAERIASKEMRKGKLYVISATVPVHPDQAKEVMRNKKQKADAAAEAKKKRQEEAAEKKRLEEQRKAEEERALSLKVKQEYEDLIASMDANKAVPAGVLANHTANDDNAAATAEEDHDIKPSPTKKSKLSTVSITVPREHMLVHAENDQNARIRSIRSSIEQEKSKEQERLFGELEVRIQAKEDALVSEARAFCDCVKSKITELTTTVEQAK